MIRSPASSFPQRCNEALSYRKLGEVVSLNWTLAERDTAGKAPPLKRTSCARVTARHGQNVPCSPSQMTTGFGSNGADSYYPIYYPVRRRAARSKANVLTLGLLSILTIQCCKKGQKAAIFVQFWPKSPSGHRSAKRLISKELIEKWRGGAAYRRRISRPNP
jgi:hypothetical protein